MTTVDLLTLRLTWVEAAPVRPAAHLLRGAVAALFPDNPLFHQHDGDQVIYRHPLVQYRWDRDEPILFAIGGAAQSLVGIDWVGRSLRIGEQYVTIRDAVCAFHQHTICPVERLLRYRFMAPWLPFNQENHRKYRSLPFAEREAERDRLAVAGLLIALRGFGVDFRTRLYAAFECHAARPCRYKGVELLGFRGRLLANVDLPDGFALGRAVSHGYGWLCREDHLSFEGRKHHDRHPAADPTSE
jgi:hypothetical protein